MASQSAVSASEVYHRRSSGLVREGRPLDAILFNFAGATIGPVVGWILLFGIPFYPGANVIVSVLVGFVLALGLNITYALFAATIPRSGGDYVFISRTFHPWLGFAMNASFMFWLAFYIGTAGALIGQLGVATILRELAVATGHLSWASRGDWFYTDWGKFISGIVAIAVVGPLIIIGRHGLRTFFRFQRWIFAFCLSATALTIIATLVMSHTDFVSSFNSYTAHFGTNGAYAKIMKEGGPHGAFSWKQTLLAVTWPTYMSTFLLQSAYWAGEHKKGLRGHIIGMPVAFSIAMGITLLAVWASTHAYTVDFLNALGLTSPSDYGMGFTPYYVELVGMWTGPVIAIILALGLSAWLVTYVPVLSTMVTRSMLAWSLDGIMPDWLGRVNRYGNPVNATLVCYGVSMILLFLYSFTSWFSVVTALLGFDLTFLVACIAAVVFPYRRRDLFEDSDGNIRVGRIPLMSITGAVGAVGVACIMVILVKDPSSGTNWPANKYMISAMVAAIVVSAAVYAIAAAVQKRRGIDVAASYRTLPIE
jgi:basic amino acid/polyamine antiporter, APA family